MLTPGYNTTNANIALFYFGLPTSRNELTPSLLGREQGMGPLTKKKILSLRKQEGKGRGQGTFNREGMREEYGLLYVHTYGDLRDGNILVDRTKEQLITKFFFCVVLPYMPYSTQRESRDSHSDSHTFHLCDCHHPISPSRDSSEVSSWVWPRSGFILASYCNPSLLE